RSQGRARVGNAPHRRPSRPRCRPGRRLKARSSETSSAPLLSRPPRGHAFLPPPPVEHDSFDQARHSPRPLAVLLSEAATDVVESPLPDELACGLGQLAGAGAVFASKAIGSRGLHTGAAAVANRAPLALVNADAVVQPGTNVIAGVHTDPR